MNMKKKRAYSRTYIIPAAVAAMILLIAGCSSGGRESQNAEAAQGEEAATVFAVNVTPAVRGEINDYIEVNGDVVSKSSVDVYADTSGKLTRLYVNVGSAVRKDQVIAEVDPSRPGMNFVPSPVKSPISGTVIAIPPSIGATIAQGVPVARVGRVDNLEIRTEVAERFISKMGVGQNALVRFAAYPGQTFPARVTELSPVVDPVTRTMELKLNLVNPDDRIKAGMFSEVKIITESKDEIVKIPADAMVERFGSHYVFVAKEDGTAEMRKVTPGIQIDSKLEITEGLAPEEQVVIRGQTLLEDGSQIRIVERVDTLSPKDVIE